MVRGRWGRLGAAILAAGAFLGTAGSSLAAIAGTYNGSGNGYTISFDVNHGYVDNLVLSCHRGAVTVAAMGAAPKVKHGSFNYSGPAHSSDRTSTLHMKVGGTFLNNGKKVKGTASTSGVCSSGKYTATK